MKVFGKIESRFWDSFRHHKVSDQGKLLAAYLLTCKHGNMVGIFSLPTAYIMGDLGWDSSTVSRTLDELVANDFLTVSEHHDYVCITRFMEHNKTENVKQVDARLRLLLHLPSTLPHTLPTVSAVIEQELQRASRYKASKDTRALVESVRKWFASGSENVRPENKRNREEEKGLKDMGTSVDAPGQTVGSHGLSSHSGPDRDGGFPDHFEQWWSQYPKREGRKGHKKQSFGRYMSRMREGVSQEAMLANVMSYARYCDQLGKTGTEYVMQTLTYLNDPDNIRNPWKVNYEARSHNPGKLSLVEQVERANSHILSPEQGSFGQGESLYQQESTRVYDVKPERPGETVCDDDGTVRSSLDECVRSG